MRFVLLAAAIAGVAGCAPEESSSDAYVVAVDLANNARVEDDRLIFPAQLIGADVRAKIDAYDDDRWWWQDHSDTSVEQVLFVSDRQNFAVAPDGSIDEGKPNPYGFIRRALSYKVKGTDILIDTVNGTVGLGSGPAKPKHDQSIFVDKSGYELWSEGGEHIRFPSLWLNIEPEVALDTALGFMTVKRAHLTVTADVQLELMVDAQLTELPDQAVFRTVYDKPYKLDPIGIIPVSARLRVDVGCAKTGGPVAVEGGLRGHAFLRGDVRYEQASGTRVDGQGTFEPQLLGKRFQVVGGGNAELLCAVEPTLTVMMWDLETGSLRAYADVDLGLSGPPDRLVATTVANADLTGILGTFGAGLENAQGALLDVQKTLWNGPAPTQ